MYYQYRRINAFGKAEFLYTRDLNLARIYDDNPIACPDYKPHMTNSIAAGFVYAAAVTVAFFAWFGTPLLRVMISHADVIVGCAFVSLVVTLGVLRLRRVLRGD